jgi:ATP-binding cassette subfamily F protein 3
MVTIGQLSVHFGSRELFSNISLFIGPRERMGLVGKNGAGKSTMLKILAGINNPTQGSVAMTRGTTVGYLAQEMDHRDEVTIREEAASAFSETLLLQKRMDDLVEAIAQHHDYTSDDYADKIEELEEVSHRLSMVDATKMDEKIERVLKGLGFKTDDFERLVSEFSGGWKMRVQLGKLLLQNPDLLLLDEPTNHLDIESIQWLEEFLVDYEGAVVLISHDRTFLDAVTKRTVEISKGKIYDYKFSYSKYIEQRLEEIERQENAASNQQKYIEKTQVLINKFRAKKDKAAFAQTLIKKLDKLEKVEVDDIESTSLSMRFPPAPHSGKVILKGHDLGKVYGEKRLFRSLEFMINRGEKIALIGQNGVGKTTLLKIILDQVVHDGEIEWGHAVQVGYYAQNQAEELDGEKTVFQTIDDEAQGDIRTQIRGLLGAFLFGKDEIDKKVKVLSGGEKARLALCKLLLKPTNFLIMDEPTNHLDLVSKEVLKQAINQYNGTLLVVSHDRDFLKELTDTVYEILPERLKIWKGDVMDFLKEKKSESIAEYERQKKTTIKIKNQEPSEIPLNNSDSKEKKKKEQQLKKLEHDIHQLEEDVKLKEKKIESLDYNDQQKVDIVLAEFQQLKNTLDEQYRLWESIASEVNE